MGDAVVDLIIGEYLYKRFPHYQEGKLSKIRAHIVNEEGLAKLAKKIDLSQYLYLSPSEENNGGREKSSILADAFEALMGAIYLESGLEGVKKTILVWIKQAYDQIDFEHIISDYKTSLQEITQACFGVIPEYILIQESGPDHQKNFEMAIKIAGKEYAKANGSSKKQAQQECAKLAYEILAKQ